MSKVDPAAMAGKVHLDDMGAYSQSKLALALTMWSQQMARAHPEGPVFVAVNSGSLLASKMVTEGFGVEGHDLGIGAETPTRAALLDEFARANGQYFDNDNGRFASPHADAADEEKSARIVRAIEATLESLSNGDRA